MEMINKSVDKCVRCGNATFKIIKGEFKNSHETGYNIQCDICHNLHLEFID